MMGKRKRASDEARVWYGGRVRVIIFSDQNHLQGFMCGYLTLFRLTVLPECLVFPADS